MNKRDAAKLLGVSASASQQAIKNAYADLTSKLRIKLRYATTPQKKEGVTRELADLQTAVNILSGKKDKPQKIKLTKKTFKQTTVPNTSKPYLDIANYCFGKFISVVLVPVLKVILTSGRWIFKRCFIFLERAILSGYVLLCQQSRKLWEYICTSKLLPDLRTKLTRIKPTHFCLALGLAAFMCLIAVPFGRSSSSIKYTGASIEHNKISSKAISNTGRLLVLTSPACKFRVNGASREYYAPMAVHEKISLPVGVHTLRLSANNLTPIEVRITISPDKTTVIRYFFEKHILEKETSSDF